MGQIDISAATVTAANQTYTGSALTPTPTVVLDGETIPSTGYDVEYSNNTNAGTAIILITGKGDYAGIVYGSFTIAKANPVYVAPTANNRTYNTSSAALLVAGSNTTPGTFTYCSTQSGTYSTTIPSQTNAGTYTTYWKFTPTDTSNYNSVGATAISTTISPKTVSSPTITLSQSTYTYSGSACQPTPTVKDGTTTISSSEYTVSYGNNVNVGTATVTITDKSGGNYTVSGSTTFTISKANSSVTAAPTAKTGQTYNGNAKVLVNAGTASGGTMYYYATTTNSKPSSTTSFTTTIPTKTNAGTYYVWYYVKGDSNHNNTAISSTSVSVTIAKANRTISFTTAPTSVEIGATITVVAAPSAGSGDGTITYSSSNTSKATVSGNVVTGVAAGTVSITATISAGTNYNSATTSYTLGVTEIIYENHYLTFVALQTGTFTFTNHGSGNNVQYSIDGGSTWVSLASDIASPSVAAGSKIMWKSTRTPGNANNNYGVGTFSSTGRFDVEGNAMSMLYGDNFTGIESIEAKRGGIGTLFRDCVNLVNAENLKLPPLTLSINAYLRLFSGCTSLITAPELPATTMAGLQSYYAMFYGCTSLTEAPEIHITTITEWGCYKMFYGCTALTKAPSILPALTLSQSCYGEMFYQCSSLQKAPELPAEVLVQSCYASMFASCSKLNYIKMMATDISATNCLSYWVGSVASTGTFVKNSAATWSVTGSSGIPSGWTVETASS